MSLPTYLRAELLEIDGQSCGDLNHRLERVEGSDPPDYKGIIDGGDFMFARCQGVKDSGGAVVDYNLTIVYFSPGHSCHGSHSDFYKTDGPVANPPASPEGDYCLGESGDVDCSSGKARVVNDDG